MSDDTDTAAASRYASRKFLLTLLLLTATTALRVLEFIDTPAWSEVVRWSLGLYMAGNVGAAAAGLLEKR